MAQVGNIIFSISADLKSLQGQLRTMEGSFNTSFGRVEGMAKNFGRGILQGLVAGLSVGAVTQFGREIMNLADSLQNLSDQTGLSVELLSGLKSPLEEAGSSMDAFAKGVFNLQKNLGNVDSDSDKVAQSIKRLGLNLDDLRNSSPDEFIRKVSDSLATIENPIERNTVLFNLLGKSAKELGPAFQQLTGRFEEFRSKGLSAADVKLIDDVGDALTRLKNSALVLGAEGAAGLLRFFGVFDNRGKIIDSLIKIEDEIARIDKMIESRRGLRAKGLGFFTAPESDDAKQLERRRQLVEQMAGLDKQMSSLNAAGAPRPQATFKGLPDPKKVKSDLTEVKSEFGTFLEGLQKQLATLEGQKLDLSLGESAGLLADLNAQFLRFKEGLGSKINALPGIDEIFAVMRDKIVAADQAIRDLNTSLAGTIARQQAMADEANEGVGIQFKTPAQAAKELSAKETLKQLEQEISLAVLNEADRRRAIIEQEYQDRVKKIQELGAIAGKTEAEITALLSQAAEVRAEDLKQVTDEAADFQTRTFERMHHAFADIAVDGLSGQIKSWEDFGRRVISVFESILTEYLAMQAKMQQTSGNQQGMPGMSGGMPGMSGGNNPFSGFMDMFGGLFGSSGGTAAGSAAGTAAGEGASYAGQGIGEIGSIIGYHKGGYVDRLPRYHVGGSIKPDEQMALLQSGEQVMNRMAVSNIGKNNFDFMNTHGRMPGESNGSGGGPVNINFNVNGANDFESFRRSKPTILADLSRAVDKGRRHR